MAWLANTISLTPKRRDYAGHWGQVAPTLCWWCDNGPPGPAFQPRDPWNQPLTWANSSYWTHLANQTVIAAYSPVDINLYDPQGRHTGKNPDGAIDMQIPGSEYFERDDDHSQNIVVNDADVLSNLTLDALGQYNAEDDQPSHSYGGKYVDLPGNVAPWLL